MQVLYFVVTSISALLALVEPRSLIISYGGNYSLQCPQRRNDPSVKWLFNQQPIVEDDFVQFVDQATLRVTVVNSSYTGRYSCGKDDMEYVFYWLLTEEEHYIGLPATIEAMANEEFTVTVRCRMNTGDNPVAVTMYINNTAKGHQRLTNGSCQAAFTVAVNRSSIMYFILTTSGVNGDIKSAKIQITLRGDPGGTTSPNPTVDAPTVVSLSIIISVIFFCVLGLVVIIMMIILCKRKKSHCCCLRCREREERLGGEENVAVVEGALHNNNEQRESIAMISEKDVDTKSHDDNPNIVSGTTGASRFPPSLFSEAQRAYVLPRPPLQPQQQSPVLPCLETVTPEVCSRETTPFNSQVAEEVVVGYLFAV
jgi:hypothetical protein